MFGRCRGVRFLRVLWWPIFIIALYVIVLWREFNCVKILQSEANKSANRWGNLRAKGGVLPVQSILSLARLRIKYIYPKRFRCLFLLLTGQMLIGFTY